MTIDIDPGALAVFSSIEDRRNGTRLTRTAAIEAYGLIGDAANAVTLARYRVSDGAATCEWATPIGGPTTCYGTTDLLVATLGGSIVYGWLWHRSAVARSGRNRFLRGLFCALWALGWTACSSLDQILGPVSAVEFDLGTVPSVAVVHHPTQPGLAPPCPSVA